MHNAALKTTLILKYVSLTVTSANYTQRDSMQVTHKGPLGFTYYYVSQKSQEGKGIKLLTLVLFWYIILT